MSTLTVAGPMAFGVVAGWITYRTIRRKEDAVKLSDLSAVLAAIGGGAVTTVFGDLEVFSAYCIGLAGGFFGYLIVAWIDYAVWKKKHPEEAAKAEAAEGAKKPPSTFMRGRRPDDDLR